MNNYSENLFAAIDTIIAERLNKLNFDRTGIYTIVSQDEKDKTKYWVTDGSIRFLATASEGTLYSQNQQVYVTIPQNNYEGDKVILGAYNSTDTTKNVQTYVDPYSRFVKDVSINIPKKNGNIVQVQANSTDKENSNTSTWHMDYDPNKSYDYIGITTSFDVNIQGYNGSYALIFYFFDEHDHLLHRVDTSVYGSDLVVSSKQMYGNPFQLVSDLTQNFILPYPQTMKPSDIKMISIALVQDGKFDKQFNEQDEEIYPYITLTDLELAFGYNKDNLKANISVLGIGADETLKYADYDKVKTRTLNLDWIYQDAKTKEFSIFNQYNLPTNIFEEYTIYWLHYVDGAGENADLSNEYNWVTLKTNTDFSYEIILDTALKTDQYKAVVKYKLKPVVEEKEKEDTTVKKEEYVFTEAEGLIFESTQLRAEPGAANASGDTIRFSFLDNCNGIFNYYGLDDRISETSRGSGPYTIVANFLDSTKWDLGDSNSRIEKVEWITPTVNTMINIEKDILISDNKRELSFYIKTIYLHEAANNRIECVVTFKNGEIRRGSINLQFGQNQTNGTTYAFNIDFVGAQNCLYLADNTESPSEIQVQASLTKSNGEPVTTPPITWSWVHLNDVGENDSHITITPVTNNIVTLSYNQTAFPEQLTLNDEKQYANFSILQATIENYNAENGVSVDLKAYLPIPLAKKDYTDISGATRIVYDTLGNSVSFSRNPYALYKGNREETNTVYWKCIAGLGATEGVPEIRTINVEEKLQHTLKPISYCPSEIPMACIAAYLQTGVTEQKNEEGETIETPKTELVWLQPLLIIQNSWNSDMINDWDGSVEIDTEKGNIKSPIFMAGKKTDNNKFTGVVLGDVQRASIRDAVGLYGFQDSWLRYKLDENGAFYVGSGNNNFISFNERIDGRSGANELVIKAQNFILETKYLTINSKEQRIAIYSDEDNPQARVILGKIIKNNEDTVYGLDIYEGAFRIYGKSYSPELKDIDDASLYFHTEVDGTVNMYINGLITRTHTFEETYKYNQNSYTYSTTMNNRIGEIETAEINIDPNANTNTVESLFNGYYISCNYNNKSENQQLDENILNYKWTSQGETVFGYPYGRSISYYDDGLKQTIPFVFQCRGTDNPTAYIVVADKSSLNDTNSTKQADLILAASVQKVPKLWKNQTTWNSLNAGIRIRQDAVYDPNGSFYQGGIGFKGTYFDFIRSGESLVRLQVSSSTLHVGSGTAFNGNVVPEMNEKYRLGSSSYKWTDIYATNNTIQTSDRNLKTNISTLSSKYKQLFAELIPVSFTFIDNNSNRTHVGFISQDVEQAMRKCGISDLEFAGFCKDIKTKVITNKLNEKIEVEDLDENGNRQYIYSLRYTEFIAIITAVLQDTINHIADIEVRLSKLEKA